LFSTTHCAGSTLILQLLYYHLLLSTSTAASWLSEACSKLAPTRVSAMSMSILHQMGGGDKPLAVIGGNCSIQGFDAAGEERFWTVTGDNVTSLTFADVTDSGRQDLLVGSQVQCCCCHCNTSYCACAQAALNTTLSVPR
jgi:hypothetical protein